MDLLYVDETIEVDLEILTNKTKLELLDLNLQATINA